MNVTGTQHSGPTGRLYGTWSVLSRVLGWTRVEQAIATLYRDRHQTTDKCHVSTHRKLTRFSARGFVHRIAIHFVGMRRDLVTAVETQQKPRKQEPPVRRMRVRAPGGLSCQFSLARGISEAAWDVAGRGL
jgi:hypothetical protein